MAMAKISTQKLVEHVGERVYFGPWRGSADQLKGGVKGRGMDVVFWVGDGKNMRFLRVGDEINLVVRCNVGKDGGGTEVVRQYREFKFTGWSHRLR